LDFGAAPAPGDRAPDATVADPTRGPTRLFAITRDTRHTLLLFDGAAATAEGYRNLTTIANDVTLRHGDQVAAHLVVPRAAPPPAPCGRAGSAAPGSPWRRAGRTARRRAATRTPTRPPAARWRSPCTAPSGRAARSPPGTRSLSGSPASRPPRTARSPTGTAR